MADPSSAREQREMQRALQEAAQKERQEAFDRRRTALEEKQLALAPETRELQRQLAAQKRKRLALGIRGTEPGGLVAEPLFDIRRTKASTIDKELEVRGQIQQALSSLAEIKKTQDPLARDKLYADTYRNILLARSNVTISNTGVKGDILQSHLTREARSYERQKELEDRFSFHGDEKLEKRLKLFKQSADVFFPGGEPTSLVENDEEMLAEQFNSASDGLGSADMAKFFAGVDAWLIEKGDRGMLDRASEAAKMTTTQEGMARLTATPQLQNLAYSIVGMENVSDAVSKLNQTRTEGAEILREIEREGKRLGGDPAKLETFEQIRQTFNELRRKDIEEGVRGPDPVEGEATGPILGQIEGLEDLINRIQTLPEYSSERQRAFLELTDNDVFRDTARLMGYDPQSQSEEAALALIQIIQPKVQKQAAAARMAKRMTKRGSPDAGALPQILRPKAAATAEDIVAGKPTMPQKIEEAREALGLDPYTPFPEEAPTTQEEEAVATADPGPKPGGSIVASATPTSKSESDIVASLMSDATTAVDYLEEGKKKRYEAISRIA